MAVESKKVRLSLRQRRKLRIRKKITGSDLRPRVCVYRSSKYTYAQVISDQSQRTLLSASTRDKVVNSQMEKLLADAKEKPVVSTKSVFAARALGQVLGQLSKERGLENLVFDRNGFLYAGRVKAVAEGMRESGLAI